MSTATENVLVNLKGVKLDDGQYCVGEYRGYDERESNGKMYYKLKLLVRDTVKKFDIKPDQVIKLNQEQPAIGKRMIVQYYEFAGKFGTNSVLVASASL